MPGRYQAQIRRNNQQAQLINSFASTKEADINEQETMSNKMDSVRVEKPEAEKSQDDRQFIKESREYSNRSVIETVVEGI